MSNINKINVPDSAQNFLNENQDKFSQIIEGNQKQIANILGGGTRLKQKMTLSEGITLKIVEQKENLNNDIFLEAFQDKDTFNTLNEQFGEFLNKNYEHHLDLAV